jgi:hypothetical protein
MWTNKMFWKDALERAIRTTSQVICALVVAAGTGLLDTDWTATLSAAGMAGVLSVLTSLAAEAKTQDGTASSIPGTGPGAQPRTESRSPAPTETIPTETIPAVADEQVPAP